MTTPQTLDELRAEFEQNGKRSLTFPVAGTLAWAAAGIFGWFLPEKKAAFALFICTGCIFPLSMLLAPLFKEAIFGAGNELDRLFGRGILMVQLVWAIAIPFWLVMPSSLPLGVGVLAGLHWLIYGWIINHWIGVFHAVTRTVLLVACWFLFPSQRFVVLPAVVVTIYLISIYVMATRPLRSAPPA